MAEIKWAANGVTTADLLARTVFYKVGHHASHNATLRPAFETLGTPELVALIPVDKKDPNITKPNGWKMPAKGLFKRLKEKTSGRVLQMDNKNPAECNPDGPAGGVDEGRGSSRITDLTIEIDIVTCSAWL